MMGFSVQVFPSLINNLIIDYKSSASIKKTMIINIRVLSKDNEVLLQAYAENFEVAEQKLDQLKREYERKEEAGEFRMTSEELSQPH